MGPSSAILSSPKVTMATLGVSLLARFMATGVAVLGSRLIGLWDFLVAEFMSSKKVYSFNSTRNHCPKRFEVYSLNH